MVRMITSRYPRPDVAEHQLVPLPDVLYVIRYHQGMGKSWPILTAIIFDLIWPVIVQ